MYRDRFVQNSSARRITHFPQRFHKIPSSMPAAKMQDGRALGMMLAYRFVQTCKRTLRGAYAFKADSFCQGGAFFAHRIDRQGAHGGVEQARGCMRTYKHTQSTFRGYDQRGFFFHLLGKVGSWQRLKVQQGCAKDRPTATAQLGGTSTRLLSQTREQQSASIVAVEQGFFQSL